MYRTCPTRNRTRRFQRRALAGASDMAWRVVIGYDGSDAGEDAVAFGLAWCQSTGDVPVVATVYPEEHPLGAGRVDAEWAAYVRNLGQETLDKAQAAAGDAAIYRLVASTSAARGIADLAEDVDAAVILVGGSPKDRIGSVTDRLLHGATVPVCVVPEAWHAPDGGVVSKIGVAFVDTKDGHEALRAAVRAANRIPARLVLYSVAARSTEHYSYIAGRRDEQVFTTPPVLRTLRRWTTRSLGCRHSSSRRRSFSRAMWSSGWGHWGPTMWTCWYAGPVATVRSAECCLVASQHAWSDAHDSRSWSYHVPRRVPQQPRIDLYLQVVGDGDPHAVIRPETVAPRTPTETLQQILARDDTPTSATTLLRELSDPAARLFDAVQRYTDGLHVAAEQLVGPQTVQMLDSQADQVIPELTSEPSWPTLRAQLLALAAESGEHPLLHLQAAAIGRELYPAGDMAAVLDWRLPEPATTDPGPLPWLPGIPEALRDHPAWGEYLAKRSQLVIGLANQVRDSASQNSEQPV